MLYRELIHKLQNTLERFLTWVSILEQTDEYGNLFNKLFLDRFCAGAIFLSYNIFRSIFIRLSMRRRPMVFLYVY